MIRKADNGPALTGRISPPDERGEARLGTPESLPGDLTRQYFTASLTGFMRSPAVSVGEDLGAPETAEVLSAGGAAKNRIIPTMAERDCWQRGQKQFEEFFACGKSRLFRALMVVGIGPAGLRSVMAEVRLLFVGEKAAALDNFCASFLQKQLERFGFKLSGRVLYNPDTVVRVASEHTDLFGADQDASQIVLKLNKGGLNRRMVAEGVLLGYPRSAAETFERVTASQQSHLRSNLSDLLRGEDHKFYSGRILPKHGKNPTATPSQMRQFFQRTLTEHHVQLDIPPHEIQLAAKS